MSTNRPSLLSRWMVSRFEIFSIVIVAVMVIGGLVVSVQDALELEQAINRNLTENLIVNQGIVNLQRELLLTRVQVSQALVHPADISLPISRFVFAEIQVQNLSDEVQSPFAQYVFGRDDYVLVDALKKNVPLAKGLIKELEDETNPEKRSVILMDLDQKLTTMEAGVKELIDLHATDQRGTLVTTRNILKTSQITLIATAIVLLFMGGTLAFMFRRGLVARLYQAVEADRLKSQLLANVSHELRTPINAIQGYSQLLLENAYGDLADGQRTTLRRVQLNTMQLQGMVNNLLDRAQLEQGKLTLRNSPFSPADFLESSHAALNILATSKGLTLTREVAPDVPQALNGDVLRLQQILFNLTSNALKFTEQGDVHARIFLPDATHWALEVSDTGIGIPEDAQPQVFAPFWQVDSSATREYRGSGLGLSIVKQLSDLMGGIITLKSEPGKGSTFTIVFPLEKTA